jgi:probable HAF family extracellular repeat protein
MKRVSFTFVSISLSCSLVFAATKSKNPAPITPPVGYSFVNINYPHSTWNFLYGINNSGYLVGYAGLLNKGLVLDRGFATVTSSSCPPTCSFKAENYPGSIETGVLGINNDDEPNFETAGWWIDKAGITHGFMRSAGAWWDVDYPGTSFNVLGGINDNNVAAGYYEDGTGAYHAYVYSQPGNQYIPLFIPGGDAAWAGGINDYSVVVGTYYDSSNAAHGFEFNPAFTALNYPSATDTYATGINNLGAIVGFFRDATGQHGFIYYGGVWEQVDNADATSGTFLWGINDDFDVVGFSYDNDGNAFGFYGTP